jgi:hypothetical protein
MKNPPAALHTSSLGKHPHALARLAPAVCALAWSAARYAAPRRARGAALVLGLLSFACGADNQELFPALVLSPVSGDSGRSEGSKEPGLPESTPPAASPGDADPEVPEIDLPLDGSLTVPVRPRPDTDPEAPAAPDGPVILSVSPENGESGVTNDTRIVITFSEPMDRASTQAAYQSESMPSGSVSFEWSEGDTVLGIVPIEPLAYGSGADPALVAARRVAYFLSASATSQEGTPLSRPYEFSYSLLRQVVVSIFAVQNRDLSGSFRSNDTYGAGDCARDDVNMCVGDVRVQRENEQSRGFMSFELSDLPAGATEVRAELTLEITGVSGNPFGNLGGLVLEHLRFDAIGADAFAAGPLEELGLIASDGGEGSLIGANVSSAVLADGAGALNQYRLRFEDATDGDNTSDAILSAWDTQRLDVSYLLP